MAEKTVKARVENLDQVTAFVEEQLETVGCPMKTMMQISVAVEEIFVNIAHYAYVPDEGDAQIIVRADADRREIEIEFRDSGIPFDPTKKADPDVTLSAEERKIGGLGIYMVKKSMDSMRYAREDGKNIFVITKKF